MSPVGPTEKVDPLRRAAPRPAFDVNQDQERVISRCERLEPLNLVSVCLADRQGALGKTAGKWMREDPEAVLACFAETDPLTALSALYKRIPYFS